MTAAVDELDVVIIGAGIIGCAIAHELGRYPIRTALIEQEADVGFGTSKANSGIIHGGHHADPATLKGRLEWEGNQQWDALARELGFGFARVGELTVALEEDELPFLAELVERAEIKGVPGVEHWTPERTLAAEPGLNPELVGAVHAPTTGVVNPYEACFGLAESAARNGVDIRLNSPARRIEHTDAGWRIEAGDRELIAQFVVNAAGLHAAAIAAMAGAAAFTLIARKGEEYLLDKRLIGLVQRVIYPCPTGASKGTLVIPTYDGTVMIGPTAEVVDDPANTTTTMEGASRVLADARRLVPAIDERDVIAQFAGSRAVLANEDFLIGPTEVPGFFNVAGIQSPGLTAAPAIAVMVVDQLAAAGLDRSDAAALLPIELPVRFIELPPDEQRRLAAEQPAYRQMVCRCEFVTEGEIRDAIRRGGTTLDGVKFRTRSGMGRCQGGFCTPRCIELLAEELGRPLAEVTKRGGDSWLVLDRDSRASG